MTFIALLEFAMIFLQTSNKTLINIILDRPTNSFYHIDMNVFRLKKNRGMNFILLV